MTPHPILLSGGAVPLAGWREIYRGAAAALDPADRPRVEAAAAAVTAILAAGRAGLRHQHRLR